uniref:glycoside hydrolase family 3 protein n=1 Tax=Acetatifactor sp. TaxID=1872090 RepID=UPI004055B5C9
MGKLYATTSSEVSEREMRNMERSRKIATQGMVLLENDGTLPLKNVGKIALFGNGARSTVKGGTGSGDVNSRFVVNVEQGLTEAGFQVTTGGWMDRYEKAIEDARIAYYTDVKNRFQGEMHDAFWFLFNNPFQDPVMIPIEQEDITTSDANTAIFVISRNSGEGKDRKPVEGEYDLFEAEKEAIRLLTANYEKVIVVLNVGSVIDTKFLRETKGINAILLMSQAGNIGGYALADVITGKATPGGHLTTTWAENYSDYPGAMEFSHMNGNVDDEYYKEGIYVGYRYFDSFGISPAYPFGYGKSYTTFTVKTETVKVEKDKISLQVSVKNTGDTYAGREVVQVYYSAPEGRLEKPYQELAAYAKTKELAPGEEETLAIRFEAERMASYDVESASWVLEAGAYYLRVGTDSRTTKVVAAIRLDQEAVTQRLNNFFAMDREWEILSAKGAKPYTYASEASEKDAAKVLDLCAEDIPCVEAVYSGENIEIPEKETEKPITVDDVKAGRATLDELVSQLTVEELTELCIGTARGGFGSESIIGAASLTPGAAGDTTGTMEEVRNIRSMVLADGPAGIRLSKSFWVDKEGKVIPGGGDAPMAGMDILFEDMPKPEIPEDAVKYYQYCTAIPIATMLAQTWDVEALEEAGDIVGEEMNELGVSLWLAPGMNIHRNPLCGRNFEYYSEDPLISGLCAAASTIGVQKHAGVGTTIKHFAFNNQEDNRMYTCAHIDERTIREIYLKGFEIAVKQSQPMSIMTSYNLINGVHTANSTELLNRVARDEWGFEGIVMSDWGTTRKRREDGDKYGHTIPAGCIKAGNDLIMPGSQEDVDDILKSVGAKEGEADCPITKADLQACVKRMIKIIMQSYAYEDAVPYQA